jgi:hypothetical protein
MFTKGIYRTDFDFNGLLGRIEITFTVLPLHSCFIFTNVDEKQMTPQNSIYCREINVTVVMGGWARRIIIPFPIKHKED